MTYKYERKYPTQCPFLRATGLAHYQAWLLQVGDVVWRNGRLYVHVKEYRIHDWVRAVEHIAPVVIGQEQVVWRLVKGRALEERVFHRPALPVPPWRVIYTLRRQYGRALYLEYDPGRRLPGPGKRAITSPRDYDEAAARKVTIAMGRPEADPMNLMRWYVL